MPIPVSKPFLKMTAKDKAYSQIRQWIIDGTLQPDEKLAEVELANAISISRTPIREALLKLSEDGFVLMATGKITRVAPLDKDNIADLYEPMAVIEGLAANQAAANVTAKDLKKLASLEKNYRLALNSNKLLTVLNADRKMHQFILQLANNPYETQFSDQLYGHILRYEIYFFKQLKTENTRIPITATHEQLLAAIARQDSTKASAAMTKEWLKTLQTLSDLQESQNQ